MNRRLISLLLTLFMLTALFPVSAAAEESVIYYESGNGASGFVRQRFTGVSAEELRYVTVFTPDGIPLTPEIGEDGAPVYGSYLLQPGTYLYAFHDPSGSLADVPETIFTLDGSQQEIETALPFAAPVFREEPAEEVLEAAAWEDGGENGLTEMPVVFSCDGNGDLSALKVMRADGAVMQPYVDPETYIVQYGNYLLAPGVYSYRLHDPMGRFEDVEDSFVVDAGGVQYVSIGIPDMAEGMCFSETIVNPSYSGLIDIASIPTPSVSPQESLDQLLHEVEGLTYADGDMDAVYNAGPDGADANGKREPRYSPVVYNSLEEAGAAVKRGLQRREKDISIRIRCDVYPSDEAWTSASRMIYAAAIQHTGEPTEGDYLRYEYGGVNCTGAAVGNGTKPPYYYEFNYAPLYFTSFAQEMELNERVVNILNELNVAGKRDEQKISAVYQYLCDHVVFEEGSSSSNTISFTAYGALIKGKASCQGIAVAFYRLCLKLGVDARVVTCAEKGHAWNIAKADGTHYYALDATWDIGTAPETRQFYLKGRTNWLKTHTLGDEFINGSFSFYAFPDEDYEDTGDQDSEATATIHSVALVLEGMLRLKYYFVIPEELRQDPAARVQFSRDGKVIASSLVSQADMDDGKCVFSCGVEVISIDEPIMLRILDGSGKNVVIKGKGESYLNGFSFSPMQYAKHMKENASTQSMRELAKALEDYGIAAQIYFKNKRVESLSDEVRSVSASQLGSWSARLEGSKPDGVREVKISCVCEADNSLRVYFVLEGNADPNSYSYQIDGEPATPQRKNDGTCYLEVRNIPASLLDSTHRFTVSNGTNSFTMICSVLSYAKMAIEAEDRNPDLANLGRALYCYNRAAVNYFGSTS